MSKSTEKKKFNFWMSTKMINELKKEAIEADKTTSEYIRDIIKRRHLADDILKASRLNSH